MPAAGFASSLSSFLVFVGVVVLVDWTSVAVCIFLGSLCPSPAAALAVGESSRPDAVFT